MSDGGPRWNVGRGSLRSSKSRSPSTGTSEGKHNQQQDISDNAKRSSVINVIVDNQTLYQRAPEGTERNSSSSPSKSSKSGERTENEDQGAGLPRPSRQGQCSLPLASATKIVPQGCGTVDAEDQDGNIGTTRSSGDKSGSSTQQ